MNTTTEICPTCGSAESVHGDCLVCNSPLAARPPTTSLVGGVPQRGSRHGRPLQTVDDVIGALAGSIDATVVAQHLAELPASYVAMTSAATIGAHIVLIERAA